MGYLKPSTQLYASVELITELSFNKGTVIPGSATKSDLFVTAVLRSQGSAFTGSGATAVPCRVLTPDQSVIIEWSREREIVFFGKLLRMRSAGPGFP
jgi:hypothetical protein